MDALPRDQWCVEKVLDLIDHMIQGEEKRREQERVERRPDRGARAAGPLGGGAGPSGGPPRRGRFLGSPWKLTDSCSIATGRSGGYRARLSGAYMLQTVG